MSLRSSSRRSWHLGRALTAWRGGLAWRGVRGRHAAQENLAHIWDQVGRSAITMSRWLYSSAPDAGHGSALPVRFTRRLDGDADLGLQPLRSGAVLLVSWTSEWTNLDWNGMEWNGMEGIGFRVNEGMDRKEWMEWKEMEVRSHKGLDQEWTDQGADPGPGERDQLQRPLAELRHQFRQAAVMRKTA